MNSKSICLGLLFSLVCSALIFFLGYNFDRIENSPKELYQVYLDGKVVGFINNDQELYNLIDKEQETLKNDYEVDKIYPPNNLELSKVITYNDDITSVKNIYEKIKDIEPFTIKGYEVTITKVIDEENIKEEKINILNKDFLDLAVKSIIKTYVDEETYNAYLEELQDENIELGTILERVDIEEEITIKEKYISTEEKIYKTAEDFNRYMLFSTDEVSGTYTVKTGDTVKTVANDHKLNVNDFLIVNPDIKGENALLFPGQTVNIGSINPLITVITESTLIENQEIPYETQIKYDNTLAYGMSKVEQEGVKGLSKYTFKTETKNGNITNVVRIKDEQISAPIDEIIVKGGSNIVYVGDSTYWAWPVLSGNLITSYYGYRRDPVTGAVGTFHAGIDLSGTGRGSPIFAIQNGNVIRAGYSGSMGYYIYIDHKNDYYSIYMHLNDLYVAVGDEVSKGDTIGTMGNSGKSTGVHLHLGIYYRGTEDNNSIDPLLLYQ